MDRSAVIIRGVLHRPDRYTVIRRGFGCRLDCYAVIEVTRADDMHAWRVIFCCLEMSYIAMVHCVFPFFFFFFIFLKLNLPWNVPATVFFQTTTSASYID